MNTIVIRLNEKSLIEADATFRADIELGHPTSHARWIELFIPGRVERIGEVDAFSIAAYFDHLRPTLQRLLGSCRMRCLPHNSTDLHRAGLFGIERIGNIILQHLSGPPAGDVEKAIVEREIDVGD